MKLPKGAHVVLGDGEKAMVLENRGTAFKPDLHITREAVQDNPATRHQGTDRPGRFPDVGVGRSAVETTDWHQLGKERFAGDLADMLHRAVRRGEITELVLVAPPGTLGILRDKLHREVKDRIVGELAKDLTNHRLADINRLIEKA